MYIFSFDKTYIYLEACLIFMKILVLMIFMFLIKEFHVCLSLIDLFHEYATHLILVHSHYFLFTHDFVS